MLRKIRVTLAVIFIAAITMLFLDFTGSIHAWMGWTAKIQFLPALLALNLGVLALLVVLTLVFGRVYCSVICPLGVMQDIFSWLGARRRKRSCRFGYTPARNLLRWCVLALFVVAVVCGIGSFVALLAPYSAYGRIASNLFAPVYDFGNNILAYFAERADSYSFYTVDVAIKSVPVFVVATLTFAILAVLAWRGGRTYCNTICPVGTVLGALSRFSLLKVRIDRDKCNACGLCSRKCKASCIDGVNHRIDYSRCVACMDCVDTCRHGAISYTLRCGATSLVSPSHDIRQPDISDSGRRNFLAVGAAVLTAAAVKARQNKVDSVLAFVEDKKMPDRKVKVVPFGALGIKNFENHCTGCQLCVSVCPNNVLVPSTGLTDLMQPRMIYKSGYCDTECVRCSQVCPTGAIRPITVEEKIDIHVGHAVWIPQNCIPMTTGEECGICELHCPVGAIMMIESDGDGSPLVPSVDTGRCIGCGACEYVCPARPFRAIYVEGDAVHRRG